MKKRIRELLFLFREEAEKNSLHLHEKALERFKKRSKRDQKTKKPKKSKKIKKDRKRPKN